jgi:hypothetical protein
MSADFVRVPYYVERDGTKTFFLPTCRIAGGYRIGPKGSETTVDDYWDALARLSAMQPPRFRRPNAENNFGIVKCEPDAFEEVSRAFIDGQLNKHRG